MKKQGLFTLALGICLLSSSLNAQPTNLEKSQVNQEQAFTNAKKLASEFASQFHGPYKIIEENSETIGSKKVPELSSVGGEVLNNNAKVSAFSAKNHAFSSIFVKSGDDFIIVATPLKRENGQGARGTVLHRDDPAYQNLIKGLGFTGKIDLFNQDFIAKFDVVKDKKDNVVGAIMVAVPVDPLVHAK